MGLEKIQQLEESHYQYPRYDIDEYVKSKPVFTVPLKDVGPLKEDDHIHLECRLEPVGDPTMRVEWFFNGRPLTIGKVKIQDRIEEQIQDTVNFDPLTFVIVISRIKIQAII